MKMKNVFSMKMLSVAVVTGLALLGSCSKNNDNPISSADSQNVNSESVSATSTNETADLANSVITNVTPTQYGGARVAFAPLLLTGLDKKDGRLAGATITLTPDPTSTKASPSGTITIDYGSVGITTNGVTRKGLITITYNGQKGVANSYRTMTFTNYSRNGILFDNAMMFKVTNQVDSTVFHHVLTGGKLYFPDQTTVSRETDYIVTIDYTNKKVTLSASSAQQNTIGGYSAKGVTRSQKQYTMNITSPIIHNFNANCLAVTFLPVQGTKSITAGLVTYSIDYGDGTCDNTITITVGGKVITITGSTSGN